MKVFVSWSGERSRAVAEALHDWLPSVIQALQPWMSANDIEKGTRWRSGLAYELEQISAGIICLTPENLASPWINFEAGALSKQQSNTFVCTYLLGLEPADLREPLAQFQTTLAEREDTRKLIHTLNRAQGEEKLLDEKVNEAFDVWWPRLEQNLNGIPIPSDAPEPQRDVREILGEILELARAQFNFNRLFPAITQIKKTVSINELDSEDTKLLAEHLNTTSDDLLNAPMDSNLVLSMLYSAKAMKSLGMKKQLNASVEKSDENLNS